MNTEAAPTTGQSFELEIQIESEVAGLPGADELRRWAQAALTPEQGDVELVIRIVDEPESAELNETWRKKSGPTNVLSFPGDLPEELDLPLLGDLVICAPVVAREAREQGKMIEAHWAHMVIHGILHLRGYDHMNDAEAEEMEALEKQALALLGVADPYQSIL